jgi:hypothetical protein
MALGLGLVMNVSGTYHIQLAFDVGFEVDLKAAEGRLSATPDTRPFRRGTRGRGLSMRAATPLRFLLPQPRLAPGLPGCKRLEASLYEFGGLCLTYSGGFDGTLEQLIETSVRLQEDPSFEVDARTRTQEIVDLLDDAVREPFLSDAVEDYVVYHVPRPEVPVERLWTDLARDVARLLRAEREPLSPDEVGMAVTGRVSYGPDDACLVDWFGALIAGEEMEDELRVLELATVELVELRALDAALDGHIHGAYEALARAPRPAHRLMLRVSELGHLARTQADSALLHQGIDNAVKLLGDDYLARLYGLCSKRFHFDAWDASIQRKLSTLDSVYTRLADMASTRRAELLEWIIILLFLFDIGLVLWKGGD